MPPILSSIPALLPEDVKATNDAIFEEAIANPAINQLHGVDTGIKADRRILILSKRLSGYTGLVKADCDITATSANFPASEKTWAPKYISDRFEECYEDLMGTVFQWMLKTGADKENLSSIDWSNFVEDAMVMVLEEVWMRIAWFGDTGIVEGTDNNLGAGEGAYFDMLDGFWKQITDVYASPHVAIAKNAEVTFDDQAFDSTDTTNQVATGILDDLFYSLDYGMRSMNKSELVYITTQSLFDQYEKERKHISHGLDLPYIRMEDGIPSLKNNGIEVTPLNFLDREIVRSFEDSVGGTYWVLPHRAILTTRENLRLGLEETSNLSQFKPFYNEYHKKYVIDYGFSMDAKVALDNFVRVAY